MSEKKIKVRSRWDRVRVQTVVSSESKVQQHYKDKVDVNNIMKRYEKAGLTMADLPKVAAGIYGDFSSAGDYMQAALKVAQAKSSFEALPADIRARFGNDPAALIDFLSKPENKDEAIRLGLVQAPVKTEPEAEPKVELKKEVTQEPKGDEKVG